MLDHSDEICVPKIINLVVCSVVCVRAHAHVLVDRDKIFALFMINVVACAPAVIKRTVVYQMVVYHFLGKNLIAIKKHMRMRTHTDDRTRHRAYHFRDKNLIATIKPVCVCTHRR